MNATKTTIVALGCVLAVACSRAGDESSATAPSAQPAAPDKGNDKGASSAAPGKGAAMPETLRAYRDVFLPIWNSQPASGRSKRACDQFSTLQKRAEAIEKQAPAGVDASVWDSARESLTLCNESISEVCDDEDIGAEDMAAEHLECIYKAVTELSALFGKDPGAGNMQGKPTDESTAGAASSPEQARAALDALAATFAAIGKQSEDQRVKKACQADLFKLATAMDPAVAAPGVDAGKWREAVTSLRQDSEEFGANCGDDDPAVQSLARNLLRSMGETLDDLRVVAS